MSNNQINTYNPNCYSHNNLIKNKFADVFFETINSKTNYQEFNKEKQEFLNNQFFKKGEINVQSDYYEYYKENKTNSNEFSNLNNKKRKNTNVTSENNKSSKKIIDISNQNINNITDIRCQQVNKIIDIRVQKINKIVEIFEKLETYSFDMTEISKKMIDDYNKWLKNNKLQTTTRENLLSYISKNKIAAIRDKVKENKDEYENKIAKMFNLSIQYLSKIDTIENMVEPLNEWLKYRKLKIFTFDSLYKYIDKWLNEQKK